MADLPTRRSAPPSRPQSPTPPTPARPGWKVTPAPDGRGSEKPAPKPPGGNQRWIVVALLVLGLLALNLWISSQALKPNPRVRIPYSPTFLTEVQSGNVSQISSTGDSIQGSFRKAVKYPPNDKSSQATTNFSTQVPS